LTPKWLQGSGILTLLVAFGSLVSCVIITLQAYRLALLGFGKEFIKCFAFHASKLIRLAVRELASPQSQLDIGSEGGANPFVFGGIEITPSIFFAGFGEFAVS
jgi:hypothetical protein